MAAKEMLKFGYQLGQGLNVVEHGKTSLIELLDNKGGTFSGFQRKEKEVHWPRDVYSPY